MMNPKNSDQLKAINRETIIKEQMNTGQHRSEIICSKFQETEPRRLGTLQSINRFHLEASRCGTCRPLGKKSEKNLFCRFSRLQLAFLSFQQFFSRKRARRKSLKTVKDQTKHDTTVLNCLKSNAIPVLDNTRARAIPEPKNQYVKNEKNDQMPVLYLLNYIELSYSEITFTYYTFDSKFSALSNFFQIDRIDEFAEKGHSRRIHQFCRFGRRSIAH